MTFIATVSSAVDTPSGTVVFLANGLAFSTSDPVSGFAAANCSLLPVGTNAIVALYASQGNYLASSSSLQQISHKRSSS